MRRSPVKRTDIGIALALARMSRDLRQEDLCQALGCTQHWISEIELGLKRPSPRTVGKIIAALALSADQLADVLSCVRALRSSPPSLAPGEVSAPAPAVGLPGGENLWRVGWGLLSGAGWSTAAGVGPPAPERPEESRIDAARRVEQLRRCSAGVRQVLVDELAEYAGWAVAEALCEESVAATADHPAEALALAMLAVRAAERVDGGDAWRCRVQGYCFAFQGNARRVLGDLAAADADFATSRRLWQAGAGCDPALLGLLDGVRLLDLEASLRRAQRRISEALGLIERALGASRSAHATARLLLKKAKTFEEIGDYDAALAVLRQAGPLIDGERQPRLLLVHRFNLVDNLCHVGQAEEAEPILADLRPLTESLGNRLDLVRLRWLEGRIAAGQGRSEEARALLHRVRNDLAAEKIPYDTALVTLELAGVYAAEGRSAEVKALARLSAPDFVAQGVHREAQAALAIFRQAAEQERVSAEMARHLVAYLTLAQYDPQLRFEAGG